MATTLLDRLQMVVVIAALASVPLTLAEVNGQSQGPLLVADWVIWAFFLFEYLLALALAENRRRHVVNAWLPLLVVVASFPLLPSVLALFRLARLGRLLRLVRLIAFGARALPALKATLGRRGMVYVVAIFAVLIVVAGAVMSIAEPATVKGGFWDGVWWAVVTATTVGYGDIAPSSLSGRMVAVVLMFCGIGLTATLAASVTAYFVNSDQDGGVAEMTARLARVEQLLVEMRSEKSREA